MRNVSKTLSLSKSPTEYKMNESITIMAVEAFKVTTITTGNKMENENKFKNDTQKNLKCHKLRINVHSHQISFKQTAATTIPTFPTDISPRISKTDISSRSILNILKSQIFSSLANHRLWLMLWLMATLIQHVKSYDMTTATKGTTSSAIRYSQLLSTNDNKSETIYEDTFRPFVPKDAEMIARNVFTPSGQFRVFQAIDTDLRATVALQMKHNSNNELLKSFGKSSSSSSTLNTNTATTSYSSLQQDYGEKEHKKRDHKTIEANLLHNANKPDTSNLAQIDKLQNQKQQQQQQQLKHNQQHQLVTIKQSHGNSHLRNGTDIQHNEITNQDFLLDPNDTDLKTDFKNLEDLLVEYVTNLFEKGQYEPMPGLVVKLQNLNHSDSVQNLQSPAKTRNARQTKGVTDAKVQIDLPRTLASGRLLFLTGLKKVLWPVFIGLQVLKSLLIAMFIPAIIGSLTRLLGKGISTGSAPLFIRPIDPPQELDFRDNNINFDDDKFLVMNEGLKGNGPYAYNHPDASQMPNDYVFDPASANNQLTFTRLGMNERQHQLMQDSYMSALQSIGSASFKNSGSLSSGSSGLLAPMAKKPPPAANVNTYQQFQKVPDSSLLLSNYDPFYSPLLSRLDSVFAQLKINSDKEICREKVICLMYANPAKYAPYSNLVSAQLSRELNELRKPTSDNPDILRFFKYMRAAKDGQDGVDCEQTFDKCTEFKDFENPAMVSTYHDINKLVQARKLNNK